MNVLETFFAQFGLGAKDLNKINGIAHKKHYHIGDVFVSLGAARPKLGIVERGLARCYRIKSSGEEITIGFLREGDIASNQDLILYNKNSNMMIEFLEPSTLLVFDYRDIEQLAKKNPSIERAKHEFLQSFLVKVLYRLETFLIYNPEERYTWLEEQQPELLERVQKKYLASYLGITPVSLSRLRTRISRRTSE